MLQVTFDSFRCFGVSCQVEIRPLTLLLGENSAGKTSFLAGLRFLLECFSPQGQAPFNRDPYYLGGFDQIAYYKGGRGGRAKAFTLAISVYGKSPKKSSNRDSQSPIAKHEFSFGKGYPQPELTAYFLTAGDEKIYFALDGERPVVTVNTPNHKEFKLQMVDDTFPPSILIRENISYIHFLFSDLRMRLKFASGKSERPPVLDLNPEIEAALQRLWASYTKTSNELSQTVFASAPVRTQPLRTYTPSDILSSSEGSNVPLELAKLKRQSLSEWQRMKQNLEKFAQAAGLFSEIDVRQFGRNDIDPFQIQVKINGPVANLVDVGYGVSQALPIVFQLQNAVMHSAYLLQQPEVHLHPRAQAELGTLFGEVLAKPQRPLVVVETHSDYMIDRVRTEVARGRIRCEDVAIAFFERGQSGSIVHNISLDSEGNLVGQPTNFRAFFLAEQAKFLGSF